MQPQVYSNPVINISLYEKMCPAIPLAMESPAIEEPKKQSATLWLTKDSSFDLLTNSDYEWNVDSYYTLDLFRTLKTLNECDINKDCTLDNLGDKIVLGSFASLNYKTVNHLYRKVMLMVHPDKAGSENNLIANRAAAHLNNAREQLGCRSK